MLPITRSFLARLKKEGVPSKVTQDKLGRDHVSVVIPQDEMGPLPIEIFFQKETLVRLSTTDYVKASHEYKDYALELVNKLNQTYSVVRFVYIQERYAIEASVDLMLDKASNGDIIFDGLLVLSVICEKEFSRIMRSVNET